MLNKCELWENFTFHPFLGEHLNLFKDIYIRFQVTSLNHINSFSPLIKSFSDIGQIRG